MAYGKAVFFFYLFLYFGDKGREGGWVLVTAVSLWEDFWGDVCFSFDGGDKNDVWDPLRMDEKGRLCGQRVRRVFLRSAAG